MNLHYIVSNCPVIEDMTVVGTSDADSKEGASVDHPIVLPDRATDFIGYLNFRYRVNK